METANGRESIRKVGFHSSWLLAAITTLTFVLAMIAIPPAGPYCPGNCMIYPYRELLQYFPRDYFWMYAAIFQICVFLVFAAANYFNSINEKRIYSFISLIFAIIASTVLMGNYFVQFAVVPVSMIQGQTEGIPLLTQYNGNGVFIALEELGFSMMAIAFFFLAVALSSQSRMEKVLRWVLAAPLAILIIAFIAYSIQYGLYRDYRYEVVAISVNWLVCILAGIFMSLKYRRELSLNKEQRIRK